MNNRWLAAYDARRTIADRRAASEKAELESIEYALIDYARTILPARCRYMWDVVIGDEGADEKRDARDIAIPTWVWELTNFMKVDWATGIFHLAGDRDGETRYIKLVGVEFDGIVIDQVWPAEKMLADSVGAAEDAKSSGRSTASNAGRKRSESWNDWVAYLAVAAPDIVREEGPEALMDKIATLMTEDGLKEVPRSTVQPAAQAVISLLERKKL